MSRVKEILDQLNAYEPRELHTSLDPLCSAHEGAHIDGGVVYNLPEFDIDVRNATPSPEGYGAWFALTDGTVIVHDGRQNRWEQYDPETGGYVEQS